MLSQRWASVSPLHAVWPAGTAQPWVQCPPSLTVTLPVIELACSCSCCPEKINKEWGLEGYDRQWGLAAIPPGEVGSFMGGLPLSSLRPPGAKEGGRERQGHTHGLEVGR